MVDRIAQCLGEMDADELNLGYLSPEEAAQVLMNSWQGAVMKMKMELKRGSSEI